MANRCPSSGHYAPPIWYPSSAIDSSPIWSSPQALSRRTTASPPPSPQFIALFVVLFIFCLQLPFSTAVRNKEIDENYQRLIPLRDIPQGCDHAKGVTPGTGDPAKEYGFVGGGLEKCRVWLEGDEQSASDEEGHYERCTPNNCQHEGELALGSKHIECICKAPWDGRFCDRLACWRMAEKENERRWRNAGEHCRCADNYEGTNCETVVSCQNGEFVAERCQCAEGWKGEVCDRKCIPNQTCSSPPAFSQKVGIFLSLFGFILTATFYGNRR
uniref:EGF-like domain-containing protein n=1 Tax=Globodera pallida TaxID=36090 RepID=A0A183BQ93_GLOPA